jgi:DNA-binding IclR family transcriptional regulator
MTEAAEGVLPVVEARETDFVQSFQRGLAVIRAFDADHPALTLSEVARATGLARAAARRFLLTLVELGYMRVEDRRFALTPRVLELGHAYLSSLSLPEIAVPYLREFVSEIRESSSLCVLDEHHIVYVGRVPANRIMSVSISVGTRFPAFATSTGRVLLAGQSEARSRDRTRPQAGLGDDQPGARGGRSLARGADPRHRRAGHRGDQRLRPREPVEPRRSPRAALAAPAGDRNRDRPQRPAPGARMTTASALEPFTSTRREHHAASSQLP